MIFISALTAKDIDKLVRFEVLTYGEQLHPAVRGKKRPACRRGDSAYYRALALRRWNKRLI